MTPAKPKSQWHKHGQRNKADTDGAEHMLDKSSVIISKTWIVIGKIRVMMGQKKSHRLHKVNWATFLDSTPRLGA